MSTIGEVQVVGDFVNTSGSGTATAYTIPANTFAALTIAAHASYTTSPFVIYAVVNGVQMELLKQSSTDNLTPGTIGGAFSGYFGAGTTISFNSSTGAAVTWTVTGVYYLKANYP